MAEYTFRTVVYCTHTVMADSFEEADEIISDIEPFREDINHDYDAWELIDTNEEDPEEGGLEVEEENIEVDEELQRIMKLSGY